MLISKDSVVITI